MRPPPDPDLVFYSTWPVFRRCNFSAVGKQACHCKASSDAITVPTVFFFHADCYIYKPSQNKSNTPWWCCEALQNAHIFHICSRFFIASRLAGGRDLFLSWLVTASRESLARKITNDGKEDTIAKIRHFSGSRHEFASCGAEKHRRCLISGDHTGRAASTMAGFSSERKLKPVICLLRVRYRDDFARIRAPPVF